MLTLKSEILTDPGKRREINEDSVYQDDDLQLWAVADGMGGHHRGDYASQTVIRYLAMFARSEHTGITESRLENLLSQANSQLIEKAREENVDVVASTCAIVSAHQSSLTCSWVGDSRIYRYRAGQLTQLTRDHSYESILEDIKASGKEAPAHFQNAQALTRGIGAEHELDVEHCQLNILPGDRYMICTDGLYKEVSNSQVEQHYANETDDKHLMSTLHHAYLEGGARDNLGLVLLTTCES